MKLKTKMNLFATVLTLIILIASFTSIYFLFKKLAIDTEYAQLQQNADELMVAVSQLDSPAEIDTLFRAYIPANGLIHVKDENGKTLIRLQAIATSEKINIETKIDEPYTITTWNDNPVLLMEVPIIWPTHEVVTAQFVQPLPDVEKNMELLRWVLILITFIAIFPIYLATSILARIIIKPIGQLTTTMKKNIDNGSFEQIEIAGKDEIAAMGTTYNELMHKIEETVEKQQQFVGNASHELKTPLTVIESYAKLLQRRGFENENVAKESVDAIVNETSNMKNMIEQMLQLARTTENVKMNWQEVSLNDLLESIQKQMMQAYNREIVITGDLVTLTTDEAKLKQLLFIFIDNARKYSDEAIKITVSLNGEVKIEIQDKGIGIPKEDIPHLFDRFYRVNKDRNRKTGGTGLGLSIASQLAKLLHANIEIESTVGIGTIVTITLPLERDQNE